jgi:hypothetical protein
VRQGRDDPTTAQPETGSGVVELTQRGDARGGDHAAITDQGGVQIPV